MDTTRLFMTIAIVVILAILLWFVLTKTSLGNSLGSNKAKNDTSAAPGDGTAAGNGNAGGVMGSKSFGSGGNK